MGLKKPVFELDPLVSEAVSQVLSAKSIGSWSSDHNKEAGAFAGFNYLAITFVGRQAARAHGYVYRDGSSKAKSLRKSYSRMYGSIWKSIVKDGTADLVDEGNRIAMLVERPNPTCSAAVFQWEVIQQLHLHGCCLIFNRPTKRGAASARRGISGKETSARYVIPLAMTQPVYPGEFDGAPSGGVRIMPYESGVSWFVNPFVSQLVGKVIPSEWMSVVRYPHPVLRSDGQSPTDAAGWWIDGLTMIDMARWRQLKRGPKPYGIISVDGDSVTEQMLDAIERRVSRKLRNGESDDDVVALGAKTSIDRNTTPVDMAYVEAFDQLGAATLAAHGASRSAVGLSESMTYGSVAAANQMSLTVVQSDLDLLGGDFTDLAKDEGESVAVEYEVQPINDSELIEQQMQTDLTAGVMLGREWRAKRGLPPFGDWRDEARVTSTGFVDDKEKPEPKEQKSLVSSRGVDIGSEKEGETDAVDDFRLDDVSKAYRPVVSVDWDAVGASGIKSLQTLAKCGCRLSLLTTDDEQCVCDQAKMLGLAEFVVNESLGRVDAYYDADMHVESVVQQLPSGPVKEMLEREVGNGPAQPKLGCIMLELPQRYVGEVQAIQSKVAPSALVGDGLEEWPHVTLCYGLVGVELNEVVTAVRSVEQVDAVFGAVATFEKDDGSVLKVDIDSPVLHRLNERIKGLFPVAEGHDYNPHLTLAYCESMEAERHKGVCSLTGKAVRFTRAVVSIGGKKVGVPLRMPEEPVDPVVKSLRFVDSQTEAMSSLVGVVEKLGQRIEGVAKLQARQNGRQKPTRNATKCKAFRATGKGGGVDNSGEPWNKGKAKPKWRRTVKSQDFIDAVRKSAKPGFLSKLEPEDLKSHKLFLSVDGTIGSAVSPDGDIQNVFNNGETRGLGAYAVVKAIKAGGITLDCYDVNLPAYYSGFGFTEIARMKFDREFAPGDWNYDLYGEPDIVFMARTAVIEEAEMLNNAKQKRKYTGRINEYTTDWDGAKQKSRQRSVEAR